METRGSGSRFEPRDVYAKESKYIPRNFTSKVIKIDGVSSTQQNQDGALRMKACEESSKESTSIPIDEVPSLGLVHVANEELQELKKKDKPFKESEDMYEVIYPNE